jgi:cellulose synthase/poly-beta-1,6-N-acetylglucosamine synthase-like glycosyltransferase
MGGWKENALTEDVEISLRLAEKGIPIGYWPDIRCSEEIPFTFKAFFKQRLRWFRGWIELIAPTFHMALKSNKLVFDGLLTVTGPAVLSLLPILGIMGSLSYFSPDQFNWPIVTPMIYIALILFSALTVVSACLTLSVSGLSRIRAVPWIPVLYVYWIFVSVVATVALMQTIVRWPRKWERTPKKGN